MDDKDERRHMNKAKSEKLIMIILLAGIILFLSLIFEVNFFHYNYAMEADVASEAILCEQIWSNKQIIPDTWYSSTEARIISTPDLGALFYGIAKDMSFAMGAACCVMTLLILGSAFYLFYNVDKDLKFSSGGGICCWHYPLILIS